MPCKIGGSPRRANMASRLSFGCDSRLPSEVEYEMDRQSAQDKFSNCRLSIQGDQHLPSLRHPAERIIWML